MEKKFRISGTASFTSVIPPLGTHDLKGASLDAKAKWRIIPHYPGMTEVFVGARGGLMEGSPGRKATATLGLFGGIERNDDLTPFIVSGEVGYVFAPRETNLRGMAALAGLGIGDEYWDVTLKAGILWDPDQPTSQALRTYVLLGFGFPLFRGKGTK